MAIQQYPLMGDRMEQVSKGKGLHDSNLVGPKPGTTWHHAEELLFVQLEWKVELKAPAGHPIWDPQGWQRTLAS